MKSQWKAVIVLCAAALAALWIMYSQAQNGRYTMHVTVGGDAVVLDSRTGTVYRQVEGGWAEFQPQTGILHVHPTQRARDKEKK